jgi:hypothetical protein
MKKKEEERQQGKVLGSLAEKKM